MKNTPKLKNVITELADEFSSEFNSKLPLTILPNNDIVFKNYIIKHDKHNNWVLSNFKSKDNINCFFLKTCALIAAKEYDQEQFGKYRWVKFLDTRYQAHYSDMIVYRYNIKKITDIDDYAIMLNKLEESRARAKECQTQISRMFKASFV